MSHICPNCGCNLSQFSSVTFGNVTIDQAGRIVFDGSAIDLPRTQHLIVEALVRAQGRALTRSVLAEFLGGDIVDNTISKYVERTRASFQAAYGKFDQVVALRGFAAYRWRFEPTTTVGGIQYIQIPMGDKGQRAVQQDRIENVNCFSRHNWSQTLRTRVDEKLAVTKRQLAP